MQDFENIQQAIDTVTRQYDDLREQGVDHRAALDFIILEHGIVSRGKLAAIINDHLAEVTGQSGTTVVGTASISHPASPAAEHRPVHGGYPGKATTSLTVADILAAKPEDW